MCSNAIFGQFIFENLFNSSRLSNFGWCLLQNPKSNQIDSNVFNIISEEILRENWVEALSIEVEGSFNRSNEAFDKKFHHYEKMLSLLFFFAFKCYIICNWSLKGSLLLHFVPAFVLFCHYRYYTDLEKSFEESYAALQMNSNYFTEDCTEF